MAYRSGAGCITHLPPRDFGTRFTDSGPVPNLLHWNKLIVSAYAQPQSAASANGAANFPQRRLVRGQGLPDVGLLDGRAMAADNGGAGNAVFPQGLAHGHRVLRTFDRTAG